MYRGGWQWMLIWWLALSAAVPASSAANVRTATLEVADLSTRIVEVPLHRAGADDLAQQSGCLTKPSRRSQNGVREGNVGLLVRNRARTSRILRVRYAPKGVRSRFTARGIGRSPRERSCGVLGTLTGLTVRVGAGDVVDLDLVFVATGDTATPEQMDGRLILTPERTGLRRVAGTPLVLQVKGVRAEERAITVTPPKVTLPLKLRKLTGLRVPVTSSGPTLPFTFRSVADQAFVDLRGPGAAALQAQDTNAVFRRTDGRSVRVTLSIKKGSDNTAELILPKEQSDLGFNEPGRYEAALPMGSGKGSPKVLLTVNVSWWWGWAALAVFVGVFLGRFVPPLLERARHRRRVRTAISQAVDRYSRARCKFHDPAGYSLDNVISSERWRLRGLLIKPDDKATRLLNDLAYAEDTEATQSCLDEALNLRAQVDEWTMAESRARPLTNALAQNRKLPPSNESGTFYATRAYQEGRTALEALKRKDTATVEACHRAEHAHDMIVRAADVWDLLAGDTDNPADVIDELWRGVPGIDKRGNTQNAKLISRLEDKAAKLKRPESSAAQAQALPMTRHGTTTESHDVGSTHDVAERLGLGSIWAALVGLVMRPIRGSLAIVAGLTTLLTLLLPALVYILTLYTDTWGSQLDVISAIAAGFAGKVAIDLGASGIMSKIAASLPGATPKSETNVTTATSTPK